MFCAQLCAVAMRCVCVCFASCGDLFASFFAILCDGHGLLGMPNELAHKVLCAYFARTNYWTTNSSEKK